jgi:hypothetical protein
LPHPLFNSLLPPIVLWSELGTVGLFLGYSGQPFVYSLFIAWTAVGRCSGLGVVSWLPAYDARVPNGRAHFSSLRVCATPLIHATPAEVFWQRRIPWSRVPSMRQVGRSASLPDQRAGFWRALRHGSPLRHLDTVAASGPGRRR